MRSKLLVRHSAYALCMFGMVVLLAGCVTTPPRNPQNICSVFRQYPQWYWATQEVQRKWGVPISIQMAIMHQESSFKALAKPPRTHILWIIPWFRPTSAYGYSQATNASWRQYQRDTGNHSFDRDSFSSAADFIGWYAEQAHRRARISKRDPFKVYLAYHEGVGGYMRGTYRRKAWLVAVARKVERRAWIYHDQLVKCMATLPKKPWWRFW